jgi:hypothetical protein
MKAKTALRLVGELAALLQYAETRDERSDLEELYARLADNYDILKKKDFMIDFEEVCLPLMEKRERQITKAVKSAIAEDDEKDDNPQLSVSIMEAMRKAESQVGTVLERDLVKIVHRDGEAFTNPLGAILSEIPACTREDALEILKAMQLDMAKFAIIPYDFYLDPVTGELSQKTAKRQESSTSAVVGRNDGGPFHLFENGSAVYKVWCVSEKAAAHLLTQLPNQQGVQAGEFYIHLMSEE